MPTEFQPSQIRGVLFDLDGTLYRQGLLRLCMALELALQALGRPAGAARRVRALRAYRGAQEQLRRDSGAGQARRQIEATAAASGLSIAQVEALVGDWMSRRPLKYLRFCRADGLEALLDRLERDKVRMGVLSDYPAEAKLQALGLEGRFWPVLCSSDAAIDAFKPHPRGYLRAAELWGLSPAEVLFVGDRADVDAAGARAAGMPCAIIGPETTGRDDRNGYMAVPNFERLSRVFDGS